MSLAADDDDTTKVAELSQEARHQQKMADVVREKLQLVAMCPLRLGQRHDARVADDGVQAHGSSLQIFDARAHGAWICQITGERRRVPPELGASGLRLGGGACRADHVGTTQPEHTQGLESEAGVTTGEQDGARAQVQATGDLFGRRCITEAARPAALDSG
jgi:hypothetical protein